MDDDTPPRIVRDDAGNRYLLLAASRETCLVRDLATGEERHVANDRLRPAGEPPLVAAAARLSEDACRELAVTPGERGFGLLCELDRRGPLAVRTLLAEYDLCESDLHGLLGELRVSGAIEPRSIGGERGYALTEETRETLRS
jgi:hypothetical protein